MTKTFEFPKNSQYPPNARFWWFHSVTCEWVKITLAPGQTLSWAHGQQTDEGYSSSVVDFDYSVDFEAGDSCPTVFVTEQDHSTDCDGRHWNEAKVFCPVEDLRIREKEVEEWDWRDGRLKVVDTIFTPGWEPLSRRQRDFTAEAAGY